MAVLAVAAAGAAAGGALFGTATALSAGWLIGATVGQLLFGPHQKVEGPRLGDLAVQASTWGWASRGPMAPCVWPAM